MGAFTCPRCLKKVDTIHTCTPTDLVRKLEQEIERLRHDIERHIAIASEHATECERLRAELAAELQRRYDGNEIASREYAEQGRELERLRAELETERMRLVMKAPITFEVACKAWGDVPSLCDDSVRKCFFAVWALLCFEWAEAMVEHAQSRKVGAGMARNPLRDAAIDAALAAKGE